MLTLLRQFDRIVATILAALLALCVFLATINLAVTLFKDIIFTSPRFLVSGDQLLDIFGTFLVILLGLELLETVKAYLRDDAIHVEVVLIVAIIALARKIVVVDVKELPALSVIGMAALILSLAASYWLVMRVLKSR